MTWLVAAAALAVFVALRWRLVTSLLGRLLLWLGVALLLWWVGVRLGPEGAPWLLAVLALALVLLFLAYLLEPWLARRRGRPRGRGRR
ncbi:hypothetical protein V8Z80_17700 [Orrella sp. JC864]|uniref:hypothetical protein n=1 Tax=Orrella sp. JC864 TaxID=3120298 RepID=UPI0012BD4159